jgi:hypothetical protein
MTTATGRLFCRLHRLLQRLGLGVTPLAIAIARGGPPPVLGM